MFEPRDPFSEPELRQIRSIGETKSGRLFCEYIQYEMEGYIQGMLRSSADDTASMAHGQAGAEFGNKILGLLRNDIQLILEQHNIEPEVQDEA